MNPNKKLRYPTDGKEFKMSYPTQDMYDELPKKKIKGPAGEEFEKPDESKLPRETVGNIIINVLANYKTTDRKEIIMINIAMERIWEAMDEENPNIDFKEKIKNFLVKALTVETIHDFVPDESKPKASVQEGKYWAWATAQCLRELDPVEFNKMSEE